MMLYEMSPPTKWQAALVGEAQTPAYFSCADCDTKDAEIAGFIGSGPTFAEIGLLPVKGSPFVNPAMFCELCFAVRKAAAVAEAAGKTPAGGR